MVEPYEGDKDYIFISYAHKDKEKVYPIINEMQKKGYRIWYDEGIETGLEWPEVIAEHLNRSTLFISFISESFVQSQNCRRELSFAVHLNKNMFSINLEPAELTLGLRMQLETVQAVMMFNYPSVDIIYDKLFSSTFMLNDALKMDMSEINQQIETIELNKSLINELIVAIGIVIKDNNVLMVKRSTSEGNLLWQFPAGIVKPSEDVERKILREVYQETGIKTSVKSLIGRRIHPNTKTLCIYYALEYESGEAVNGDEYENNEVKWVPTQDYLNYITSDIYDKVKVYIEGGLI